MSDVVVLTRNWNGIDESGFVVRTLAGLLSRHATVHVCTPGPPGRIVADGLYDVRSLGGDDSPGSWPASDRAVWPSQTATPDAVLLETDDVGAQEIASRHAPGARVLALVTSPVPTGNADAFLAVNRVARRSILQRGAIGADRVHDVGIDVPVNTLAAAQPHNGLGFSGYVLVLSDRDGDPDRSPPTAGVAWLTARFPDRSVVVIEGGRAAVWRARALRGVIAVDTRIDLWRLMAHAAMTVDLGPGPLIARECVESLRFGTPIVVPDDTVGADLAALGGGLWFHDVAGMLGCVEAISASEDLRIALSARAVETDGAKTADTMASSEQLERILALA